MALLSSTAQTIMDLYYQQYKSDEDFFEFEHFLYLASVAFAKVLQDEWERSWNRNKADNGTGEATINPEWYITEEIDVVASDIGDREIKLADCPFTFKFDKQSTGIQGVYPLNGKCGEFIRISMDEAWKVKNAPVTNIIWFYPFQNKIIFENVKCGLKSVRVTYIPSLKSDRQKCKIADGMEEDIIKKTLELMFVARSGGTPIDMSANQNPNKAIESEIDTAFNRVKR